jgi:hypothetical protein
VQQSLSKTLPVITGLLVLVLISVFAVLATKAFERLRDADLTGSFCTKRFDRN